MPIDTFLPTQAGSEACCKDSVLLKVFEDCLTYCSRLTVYLSSSHQGGVALRSTAATVLVELHLCMMSLDKQERAEGVQ